jgi:hypothetical protein
MFTPTQKLFHNGPSISCCFEPSSIQPMVGKDVVNNQQIWKFSTDLSALEKEPEKVSTKQGPGKMGVLNKHFVKLPGSPSCCCNSRKHMVVCMKTKNGVSMSFGRQLMVCTLSYYGGQSESAVTSAICIFNLVVLKGH